MAKPGFLLEKDYKEIAYLKISTPGQTHGAGNLQPLPQHPLPRLRQFSKHRKPHRSRGERPSRVADPRARRGRRQIRRRGTKAGVHLQPVHVNNFGEANAIIQFFHPLCTPRCYIPMPLAVSSGLGGRLRKSFSRLVNERSDQQEAPRGLGRIDKTQRATLGNNSGEKGELGKQAISHNFLFCLLIGSF